MIFSLLLISIQTNILKNCKKIYQDTHYPQQQSESVNLRPFQKEIKKDSSDTGRGKNVKDRQRPQILQ